MGRDFLDLHATRHESRLHQRLPPDLFNVTYSHGQEAGACLRLCKGRSHGSTKPAGVSVQCYRRCQDPGARMLERKWSCVFSHAAWQHV